MTAVDTPITRHAREIIDTAHAVFSVLGSEPRTLPEIVRLTGKPRSTVHRHVAAFVDAGLAVRTPRGWRLPGEQGVASRCLTCRRPLTFWAGRWVCVNPQCPGGAS